MATIQVAGTSSRGLREYRKGNWTIEETMVLIEAKKLDEERRLIMKRDQTSSSSNIEGGLMNMVRSKPAAAAELRWKWIEDYCWTKSCLRSQNQCNDKWDNLMRDFKKVRDYENSCTDNVNSSECCSYWKMERRERKDKNLPSNILPQIYEALVQVMERKGGQRGVNVNVMLGVAGCGSSSAATTTTSSINPNMSFVMQTPPTSILQQQQYLSSQPLHLPLSAPIAALPLPPLPSPPPQLPLPTVGTFSLSLSIYLSISISLTHTHLSLISCLILYLAFFKK